MIKIAVVGFGFMGITHTINILKNPLFKLVALVDKYPENISEKLKGQLGNFSTGTIDSEQIASLKTYSGLQECLDSEKLDAVVISVHVDLHFELTRMALNSGVHVFLEKPFSLSLSECHEMTSLAKSKDLTLMIGHVVRFMPAYQQLKEWIDSREYGELQFLSLSRFSGLPVWGQWKDKQKDFGVSGGALFDLVIHDIDWAQWVLGEPDYINARILPGKLSRHDYLNAVWNYESGLTVKIEGGNIFHTAFPFMAGFSARFENASISYSSSSPENIKVSDDLKTILVPAGDANDGFSGEINYFGNCLKNNRLPEICTPESAAKTIGICDLHVIP